MNAANRARWTRALDQTEGQGPLNGGGGGSNGGVSRSGLVLPFLSFFVLFWSFPNFSGIFPICSGMVRGFSWLVLFLFLGLLRAPTRNSPERVRDTIWTFPKKVGNTRVWKPPGLASLKKVSVTVKHTFFCNSREYARKKNGSGLCRLSNVVEALWICADCQLRSATRDRFPHVFLVWDVGRVVELPAWGLARKREPGLGLQSGPS